MKGPIIVIVFMLMTMIAGSAAFAGRDSDACRREETRLRAEEADRCTGWNYVLNPSACFNTRKALAPYDKAKCGEIATEEGGGKTGTGHGTPAIDTMVMQPIRSEGAAPRQPVEPRHERVQSSVEERQLSSLEQLRHEVAELRSEVQRLKDEIARLKGGR